MSYSGAYRVNEPKVVSETLDGETIAIDLESGSYFSMNPAASVVWNLILDGHPAAAFPAVVAARFDVAPEDAAGDIERFVESLVRDRLVVAAEPRAVAAPVIAAQGRAPYEAPSVERFDDMQELLLADPIHDVTLAGWPHLPPN